MAKAKKAVAKKKPAAAKKPAAKKVVKKAAVKKAVKKPAAKKAVKKKTAAHTTAKHNNKRRLLDAHGIARVYHHQHHAANSARESGHSHDKSTLPTKADTHLLRTSWQPVDFNLFLQRLELRIASDNLSLLLFRQRCTKSIGETDLVSSLKVGGSVSERTSG